MGNEDMVILKAWIQSQKILILVLVVSVVLMFTNLWQLKKNQELRFYYESAIVSWVKAAGGVNTPEQLSQLIVTVSKSNPKRLVGKDELVDFGIYKDSSGTWKVSK